jgi:hypothetical protein
MFRTARYLAAAILLVSAVGGCTAAAATTAPASNPTATASAAGGGAPSAVPSAAVPSAAVPSAAVPSAAIPSAAGPSAATSGGALGGTVAPGGNFCGLLGPGDFAAVGVSGARTPTKNSDGPADAYCVYSGISGATGGIEFDIFIGDPVSSYRQIVSNGALVADTTGDLPGVDNVGTVMNGPGNMAAIGVQKGRMTFDIDVPTGANARAQLIALAKLVLQRSSALSG